MLPEANGFKSVSFDELDNHFGNDQQEYRGYLLSSTNVNTSDEVAQISEGTLEGTIIYKANPIDQFNEFTAKCSQLNHSTGYYASKEQLDALELVDGDIVEVSSNNQTIKLTAILDNQIAGKIGYVSTFEKDVPTCSLFNNYRFSTANIKKV